jgi:hypothetical protein
LVGWVPPVLGAGQGESGRAGRDPPAGKAGDNVGHPYPTGTRTGHHFGRGRLLEIFRVSIASVRLSAVSGGLTAKLNGKAQRKTPGHF